MRISGINVPDNKKVEVSLTYLYGIGPALSKKILTAVKVDAGKRAKDLTQDEVGKIKEKVCFIRL